MKFKNEKGESLEISPVCWEFPNEDWIIIKVKGIDKDGEWEGLDPSLMYEEALELSNWLVSPNSFRDSKLEFLEPELEFRFKEGELLIFLEWKLRPPWKPSKHENDEDYSLSFKLTMEELREQSIEWSKQLKQVYDNR